MADGAALLALYRAAGRLAAPALPLLLARRARAGKEDAARLGERRGIASCPRPAGPLVWIHAASVGETNAALPLIARLAASGVAVLLTTVTTTSAAIAAARLPAGAFHQFAPLDVAPFVGRFLDHWRPDLALFVESELWPLTIASLSARRISLVLVNARMSERSHRGWGRLGGTASGLFGRIGECLAQSPVDAERFRGLGAPNVAVAGNLKFDVPPPPADPARLAALRAAIGTRPAWVAASTHPGEETIAGAVHAALKPRHPALLTIVVPRHPGRGPAIAAELAAAGLTTVLRSVGAMPEAGTDIYVADTLGELGLFYRLAPIAFVGGSLVPHGGQNPIEPARLDSALIHGPHVHNFHDIYAALAAGSGASEVADPAALVAALDGFLGAPEAARQQAGRAAAALAPFCGALEAHMQALAPYLERARRAGAP